MIDPNQISYNNLPEVVKELYKDLEKLKYKLEEVQKSSHLPEILPIKKASELAGKTQNALRVQISVGNLKAIKKQGRLFFERDYFLDWLKGKTD